MEQSFRLIKTEYKIGEINFRWFPVNLAWTKVMLLDYIVKRFHNVQGTDKLVRGLMTKEELLKDFPTAPFIINYTIAPHDEELPAIKIRYGDYSVTHTSYDYLHVACYFNLVEKYDEEFTKLIKDKQLKFMTMIREMQFDLLNHFSDVTLTLEEDDSVVVYFYDGRTKHSLQIISDMEILKMYYNDMSSWYAGIQSQINHIALRKRVRL